jgi:hypothetical protein
MKIGSGCKITSFNALKFEPRLPAKVQKANIHGIKNETSLMKADNKIPSTRLDGVISGIIFSKNLFIFSSMCRFFQPDIFVSL